MLKEHIGMGGLFRCVILEKKLSQKLVLRQSELVSDSHNN